MKCYVGLSYQHSDSIHEKQHYVTSRAQFSDFTFFIPVNIQKLQFIIKIGCFRSEYSFTILLKKQSSRNSCSIVSFFHFSLSFTAKISKFKNFRFLWIKGFKLKTSLLQGLVFWIMNKGLYSKLRQPKETVQNHTIFAWTVLKEIITLNPGNLMILLTTIWAGHPHFFEPRFRPVRFSPVFTLSYNMEICLKNVCTALWRDQKF